MKLSNRFRIIALGAVVATPALSYSQTPATGAPALTLAQAVSIAASDNPQVAGSRAGAREARADVASARSSLFPKIGASETFTESTDPVFAFGARLRQGRFTANDFSPSFLNSPGPTSDYTSTAGATWTVFDSSRTEHQIRSARSLLTASEQQQEATEQAIAFATIRAYYRALLADAETTATAAAVERAEAFAKQAHDRVETGMALVADTMQADVEVASREDDRAQANSNAQLASAELAGLLGDPGRQISIVAPTGTPAALTDDLSALKQRAVAKRPDLAAMRSRITGVGEQVKAARASFGPQVSTYGNVEVDNPHPFSGGATNWTVGAKIELQIFDGGTRRAAISKASAQGLAAQAAYKQAETQAILDVQRAYSARQTGQRQYEIAGDMLAKTQESLHTAEDRYGAGLVTVSEVLRQQEQLRDMEISRTQALHQWWIADAQLRLATGQLEVPNTGVKP
jgi:outer membrane protein